MQRAWIARFSVVDSGAKHLRGTKPLTSVEEIE